MDVPDSNFPNPARAVSGQIHELKFGQSRGQSRIWEST